MIQSCVNLVYFLLLQLFHITSDDEDGEEDDVLEDVDVLINDINHILLQILNISSDDEEESNPLVLLTDVCITILSFYNDKHSCNTKGSCITLLQRIVKMTFKSCFKHCNDLKSHSIDMNVMNILLESTCVDYFSLQNDKEDMEEEEDGGESSDDDSESESSIEDENVFATAAAMQDLDLENMDVDDYSTASSDIHENETKKQKEDEIMLDTSNLEDHLLNSDSEDELVLEHDEKADPALIKLIKLKQQQRKKAIQEKLSIQLSHQLRCIPLIQILLSSVEIMDMDVVYMSIITCLVQRRLLEKQINKDINDTSTDNNLKDKQLLLDKIDHLLMDTLCKIKLASF